MRARLSLLVVLALAFAAAFAPRAAADEEPMPTPAPEPPPSGTPALISGPIEDPRVPLVYFIHGGGWVYTGRAFANDPAVHKWTDAGMAVWSRTYRPGADSLVDAEMAYRKMRRRFGPRRRICVQGRSAGAQLALMVAASYPSVDCVIADSGVVDFAAIPEDSPLRPVLDDRLLPRGGMKRWDPLTNADRIRQPTLLIHHVDDPIVPVAQSERLQERLRRSRLLLLPRGETSPVNHHGLRTTKGAWKRAARAELALVRDGRWRCAGQARSRSAARCNPDLVATRGPRASRDRNGH